MASFRKKARVPVLSYLYPNGSSLTRCSQPSVGLKRARNVHDENLFRAILLGSVVGFLFLLEELKILFGATSGSTTPTTSGKTKSSSG